MVLELKQIGFELELVLQIVLWESESNFLGCLEELKPNFIVPLEKSWSLLPLGKRSGTLIEDLTGLLVMELKKPVCKRNYLWQREVIWEITTDPETMPENSTWYVMTEIPSWNIKMLNLYGCRIVEYTKSK